MAIPPFDHGFLPVGVVAGHLSVPDDPDDANATIYHGHPCDGDDVYDALVKPWASESTSRPVLWTNLESLVDRVETMAPCSLYMISGPFVTEITDPEELWVRVVFSYEAFQAADPDDKWLLPVLVNEHTYEYEHAQCRILTRYAFSYPVAHPEWARSLEIVSSLRLECSYPTEEDREAGYLELTMCEGGDFDPSLSDLLANAT